MTKQEQSAKQDEPRAAGPHLNWDRGSAYDFFISLVILHDQEKYGLRGSWAAGVRSRLSADERQTLETAVLLFDAPIFWIYQLPAPKDAQTALWALKGIPPGQRLAALTINPKTCDERADILQGVGERGEWTEEDLEALRSCYREKGKETPRQKELTALLEAWAEAESFGQKYLEALQSYYNNFFAEEETRIAGAIESGLRRAQDLSKELSLAELLEQLSQGVHAAELLEVEEVTLAPSYWLTPFLYLAREAPDHLVIAFGARPEDASIVPGESVPDSLLRTLKALADPTRLRILRYLADEPLTQAELARRLRLRAPTITHHLSALRLAGLIHVNLAVKDERRYQLRNEAVEAMPAQLKAFLHSLAEE